MSRIRDREHHSVYVVPLDIDGQEAYYVGLTGLTPEARFANHKSGIKAARVVRRYGVGQVPEFYAHLNPMTWEEAVATEPALAEELRRSGYRVLWRPLKRRGDEWHSETRPR